MRLSPPNIKMCVKCKNNSCSGGCTPDPCSKEIASLQNMLAEYAAKLASVESAMKPFINGHPILALQNADDIALFDTDTGLGTKHWEGYGICNGDSYYSESAKKMIATPNLIDKMIVGAGSDYDVDDTGGAKTVTLDISEVPAHAHTLTDPGHSHTVTDAGHSHGVTQSPHTHSLTDPGHTHDATVTQAPNFHQNFYLYRTASLHPRNKMLITFDMLMVLLR